MKRLGFLVAVIISLTILLTPASTVLAGDKVEVELSELNQGLIDKVREMASGRIEKIYAEACDIPGEFVEVIALQKKRLEDAREKYGKPVVLPGEF